MSPFTHPHCLSDGDGDGGDGVQQEEGDGGDGVQQEEGDGGDGAQLVEGDGGGELCRGPRQPCVQHVQPGGASGLHEPVDEQYR